MKNHDLSVLIGACALCAVPLAADAAQIYDITIQKRVLYGPGPFPDQQLAKGRVREMHFQKFMDAIVPAFNNGAAEPNVSGEKRQGTKVDGKLSDGTKLNENIEMGNAVIVNGQFNLLLGAVFGGPAKGSSHFFLDDDYNWTIRDDIAMDPGFAEGIVKIYDFMFSTGPKPVPFSIQTANHYPGGLDRVGTLSSGDVTIGRIGDDDFDGKVDGVFFAMGQLPLSSAFLPGAPFVQRLEFTSSIPIKAREAALLTTALARNCLRTLVEAKSVERSTDQLRTCADERAEIAVKQIQRAADKASECEAQCDELRAMASELKGITTRMTDQQQAQSALGALNDVLARLVKLSNAG
jgi:hypothetical protein